MANGRYALIIASNRYTDKTLTQLKAPVIDAERLSKLLKDSYICGEYEVKILQDMQSNILRKEIERFFTKADKDDLRLIYFACHGVKPYYNFRLYLATEDSDLELLESTTIPAEFLVKQIQNSKASKIVVILDCCYSGSVSKEIRGGGRSDKSLKLPEDFSESGCVVLTSSTATQQSFEGEEIITVIMVTKIKFP